MGADRVTHHADGSITLTIIGNVGSIQVPGKGRVYSDVGRVSMHISFPDPEGEPVDEVSAAGQHSDIDPQSLYCDILAG